MICSVHTQPCSAVDSAAQIQQLHAGPRLDRELQVRRAAHGKADMTPVADARLQDGTWTHDVVAVAFALPS